MMITGIHSVVKEMEARSYPHNGNNYGQSEVIHLGHHIATVTQRIDQRTTIIKWWLNREPISRDNLIKRFSS